ncbi:MAG: hypothetical protein MHPSP_003768, partial [Paramarteilia canceri]
LIVDNLPEMCKTESSSLKKIDLMNFATDTSLPTFVKNGSICQLQNINFGLKQWSLDSVFIKIPHGLTLYLRLALHLLNGDFFDKKKYESEVLSHCSIKNTSVLSIKYFKYQDHSYKLVGALVEANIYDGKTLKNLIQSDKS